MAATVVLIHGGWSGSWTWQDVSRALDERGIPNRAVDLPSCSATAPMVQRYADYRPTVDAEAARLIGESPALAEVVPIGSAPLDGSSDWLMLSCRVRLALHARTRRDGR